MSFGITRSSPIGLFDSGVGGLTVARELKLLMPDEQIVYVADQAHVPYGGRPLSDIKHFATGISRFLAASGCKAIVMACNISSAVALETVINELLPIPVIGVIDNGSKVALQSTKNNRIGVLATQGTVQSGAYTRALLRLSQIARFWKSRAPSLSPSLRMSKVNPMKQGLPAKIISRL